MNANDSGVSSLSVIGKVLVVFLPADVLAHLFASHAGAAFAVGLVIGAVLQLLVPPRGSLKQFLIVLGIALLVGLVRPFVH